VPAREQLGEMLLQRGRPAEALAAFKASLAVAPGRRGALTRGIAAAEKVGVPERRRSGRRFDRRAKRFSFACPGWLGFEG